MGTGADRLDHTPLSFGKYRGKTPSDIAETEDGARWLKWAYENVTNRPVCSELLAKDCGYRPPVTAPTGAAIAKNTGFEDLDDGYEDDIPFKFNSGE